VPTEQPLLFGEISASFYGWRVPRGRRDGFLRSYSWFCEPEPLLFLLGGSSVVLARLGGSRSGSATSGKVVVPGVEAGPLDLLNYTHNT
jgi:hypothetical protein